MAIVAIGHIFEGLDVDFVADEVNAAICHRSVNSTWMTALQSGLPSAVGNGRLACGATGSPLKVDLRVGQKADSLYGIRTIRASHANPPRGVVVL